MLELRKVHKEMRDEFQRVSQSRKMNFTYWQGMRIVKPPEDVIRYHEIIWETKPDIIVECGTCWGSSAAFFQHNLDMLGNDGYVITIDVRPDKMRMLWTCKGVVYLVGSSVEQDLYQKVLKQIAFHSEFIDRTPEVMVSLDSNHRTKHVLKELELYHLIVTKGQYMVVDDTAINGRPILSRFGSGPGEALDQWLPKHPEFQNDEELEGKYLMSYNYGGWLKRVK